MNKSHIKINAEIEGIKYKVFLNKKLSIYSIENLYIALNKESSFLLELSKNNKIAVSWWVSPKRTRSYPYARIYDTLGFSGKKVTIIPIMKDEGKDGDRDFLQWDTISLMSLLGIYVIIGYYTDAERNEKYNNKITKQKFNIEYLKEKIQDLLSYQSDPLHWNLKQIDNIANIAEKALSSYKEISRKLDVEMHSLESAKKRIEELKRGKERFMNLSRELAHRAQERESITNQPKENLEPNTKGIITIKNFLGGYYYFTCDEVKIEDKKVYLIEGKHTTRGILPSKSDIKDGLIKMILYTNLKNVKINNEIYKPIPVLKLTSGAKIDNIKQLMKNRFFKLLLWEAKENNFKIKVNDSFISI